MKLKQTFRGLLVGLLLLLPTAASAGISADTQSILNALPHTGQHARLRTDAYTDANYYFLEGTGTTTRDETGNNPLTFHTGATWATDLTNFGPVTNLNTRNGFVGNGGVHFNGTTGLSSTALWSTGFPAQWSIEMWVTPDVAQGTATTRMRPLWFQTNSSNFDQLEWRFSAAQGGTGTCNRWSVNNTTGGTGTWTDANPLWPHVNGGNVSWAAGEPVFLAETYDGTKAHFYVNGVEAFRVTQSNPTTSGSPAGLGLGGQYNITDSIGWVGTIHGARFSHVYRSPEEIRLDWQQLDVAPTISEASKWTHIGAVLSPAGGWEGTTIYEPRPITDRFGNVVTINGNVYMTYTGGWTHPCIGLAHSSNGTTWTRDNSGVQLIGDGVTNSFARSRCVFDNNTFFLFCGDQGNPGHVLLYTANVVTGPYTLYGTMVTGQASGPFGMLGNVFVIYNNNRWDMGVEAQSNDGFGAPWQNYLFTAQNIVGPWTSINNLRALESLNYGPMGCSVPSQPRLINGLWRAEHHVTFPSQIIPVYSSDLVHWTADVAGYSVMIDPPGVVSDATKQYDQVADPSTFELHGISSYLLYDVDNNNGASSPGAAIYECTFAGTLAQLYSNQPTVNPGDSGPADSTLMVAPKVYPTWVP